MPGLTCRAPSPCWPPCPPVGRRSGQSLARQRRTTSGPVPDSHLLPPAKVGGRDVVLRDHVSALCSFESPLEGLRMIDGESGAPNSYSVLNTHSFSILPCSATMRRCGSSFLTSLGIPWPPEYANHSSTCDGKSPACACAISGGNVFGLAPG